MGHGDKKTHRQSSQRTELAVQLKRAYFEETQNRLLAVKSLHSNMECALYLINHLVHKAVASLTVG